MRKTYQKLVRDRIPEIIENDGKMHCVRTVRGNEYREYAMEKLREEVNEFLENPCAEEAADILEIFDIICERERIGVASIRAQRLAKRATRGSYSMGFVLEWVEEE